MNNTFEYVNPVRIVYGQNCLTKLKGFVNNRRTLLLTTRGFSQRGMTETIQQLIDTPMTVIDTITPNPTIHDIAELHSSINLQEIDVIVALGGGSVIDTAKVLSVITAEQNFSSVEKLIKGERATSYTLCPIISIPTTSGSSSELTPWATVWDPQLEKKYSLHLKNLWCESALYDPMLTLSLSRELTIQTALDAMSHAFESLWNKNANPISCEHALQAIQIIWDILPKLADDLSNVDYRERIMYASIKSGLAFSNTQTAIAHAISYSLTLKRGIPHGIACSITLPFIIETVFEQKNVLQPEVREKLTFIDQESFEEWFHSLGVSCLLSDYGVTQADLEGISEGLSQVSRAQNSLVDKETLFERLRLQI